MKDFLSLSYYEYTNKRMLHCGEFENHCGEYKKQHI